jgi:hypothetical protein
MDSYWEGSSCGGEDCGGGKGAREVLTIKFWRRLIV